MKTYAVNYLIEVDNYRFITMEVVKASNVDEAFCKARDKGEQRYKECRCVISENILHPDSIVEDISNIDFKAELNKAFAELDLL